MIFYPKIHLKNVLEITPKFLQDKGLQALLLDVDNTLIDYDNIVIEGIEEWIKSLKENNIKLCILSNTNNKKKAQRISKLLDIPYIYFEKKPLKFRF